MQRAFSLFFVILFWQQMVFCGEVELTPEKKRRMESDAIVTYETIISLCKMEKFDQIYEYGDKYSRERMSKERFLSEHKSCGLASSWETIRDIAVEIISPTRVNLRATLGFTSRAYGILGETKFYRVTCRMTLEDGEWKVNLSQPFGVVERELGHE